MSDKLKPCPCGKTPTKLVLEEGATSKYAYCGGNCCGSWLVEFPTGYAHVSSYAAMEMAIPAWNGARRNDDELRAENERIRAVLADPVAVHANTLRGTIAKLSDANVKHVYPHLFKESSSCPDRGGGVDEMPGKFNTSGDNVNLPRP